MNKDRKIERQEQEIQRLRERVVALQDENSALKQTLSDKEARVAALEEEREARQAAWEQHLEEHAKAIEEAHEAEMFFAENIKQVAVLRDQYKKEMDQFMRDIRKSAKKGGVDFVRI